MKRLSLGQSTELYRLLGDASRLRLLAILDIHALSVAELTQITGLAQSRVSTHLARLKRAGLVRDQRHGPAALYSASIDAAVGRAEELWQLLRSRLDDPLLHSDRERAEQVLLARRGSQTWAESVAGSMELHYSPGRTWETTARALSSLLQLGDTLDIACGDGAFAHLIAAQTSTLSCIDISAPVLAAARRRLGETQAKLCRGDMHALPFAAAAFDLVFAMHALIYASRPAQAIGEAARVLRRGGRFVVATLAAHTHESARETYDHANLGVTPDALRKMLQASGLDVEQCEISGRETRAPYFEVITALARKR